jgi:hypothetical protein
MKFLRNFFGTPAWSTLIAVVITGIIVHALTDFGFWASAFFGYISVDATSASNRVETAEMDVKSLYRRLDESQKEIEHLWGKLSDLTDRVDDAEVSKA